MADTIKDDDLTKLKAAGSQIAQPPGQPSQPIGSLSSRPQGTGFTNIQRVIGANQGNKLGAAVVGGIQKVGEQAQQGVNQAKQDYNTQLQQNQLGSPENQAASTGLINRAMSGGTISDKEAEQAAKFRGGQYTGPTDLANSNVLLGRAAEAEQLGKLGASEGGRQGLLQRFVGAPQYTQGQQKLDTLLLGANSNALNQARGATQGLSGQALRQVQGARAQGEEAQNQAQQFGKQFTESLTGKTGEIGAAQKAALEAAQGQETARNAGYEGLKSSLAQAYAPLPPGAISMGETPDSKALSTIANNPSLSPEMKQQLSGIISRSAQSGINPINSINAMLQNTGASNLSSAGVTTQQQAASLNALAKLSGQQPGEIDPNTGKYVAGNLGYKSPDSLTKANDILSKISQGSSATKGALERYLAGKASNADDKIVNKMFTPEDRAYVNSHPELWQNGGGIDSATTGQAVNNIIKTKAQKELDLMKQYESGQY